MFSEYSFWWLIPIFIISLAGTMILYFYPQKDSFEKHQLWILLVLRFLSLFLILSLIISPVIRHKKNIIQKPIIVIAQDNSSSILQTNDSSFYKSDYLNKLANLKNSLSKDYDVKLLSFGSKVKEIDNKEINKELTYSDYATDISDVLSFSKDKYSNNNLSALIICSDGIINKGNNPLNTISDMQIPVFTVAMGDTTIRKDIAIGQTRFNRISYLNNKFPLEVVVMGYKAQGEKSVIRIKKEGKTLFEESFFIDNELFSKNFTTNFIAEKVGVQKYTISIDIIKNEQTITNNTKDIFIEVLDSREKVLLVANSPHPDISALKQCIESNDNYEVNAVLYNQMPKDLQDYDIAILHQIPSSNTQQIKDIERLKGLNIPILFIIGSQTNISYFNSLSSGVKISNNKGNYNDVSAIYNSNFTLFSISKETEGILSSLPDVVSAFGNYNIQGETQSLVNQKIGNVSTNYPLIWFTNNPSDGTKTGVIAAEGFWRWRLQNYLINQTHNQTNEIIHKSIQYLAAKVDKSRFIVICNDVFAQNEPIVIDAELYNESYELINEPEVDIIITNQKGEKYPFSFSKTSNAYHLNLNPFASGRYNYVAKTKHGSKVFTVSGTFYVSSIDLENANLIADHNLLYNISNLSSSEMVYAKEIEKLSQIIKKHADIKPIIFENTTNTKFIDLWWYLLIIIALLSTEWFLRKYWGKI